MYSDDALGLGFQLLVGVPALFLAGLFFLRDRQARHGTASGHAERARADERASQVSEIAKGLGLRWDAKGVLSGDLDGRRATLLVEGDSLRLELPVFGPLGRIEVARVRFGVAGEVPSGDEAFDRFVTVSGRPQDVVPALTAEVRAQLLTLLEWTAGRVKRGILTVPIPPDAEHLVERLRGLRELGRPHGPAVDVLVRHVATTDPLPSVRARALTVLGSLEDRDAAFGIAVAALADPFDAVRLAAFRFLTTVTPLDVTQGQLQNALADESPGVRALAVTYVGRSKQREHVDAVLLALAHEDDDLAGAAALAAGLLEEPRAESGLISLLSGRSQDVQLAAINALGVLGTLASVEPLMSAARDRGVSGRAVDASREAIRRIQARAGDADQGRLSIVEPGSPVGALSVAVEGGELSIVEGEGSMPARVRGG